MKIAYIEYNKQYEDKAKELLRYGNIVNDTEEEYIRILEVNYNNKIYTIVKKHGRVIELY